MDANELLREMIMPDPCHQGWDTMPGDDRKRFCESCGKHVHNLTAMRPHEIVTLFQDDDASVCGRVARRSDGTLYIPDDAGSAPSGPRRWQFHLRSIMGVIAAVAGMLGVSRLWPEEPDGSPVHPFPELVSRQSPPAELYDGGIRRVASQPRPAPAQPAPPPQ